MILIMCILLQLMNSWWCDMLQSIKDGYYLKDWELISTFVVFQLVPVDAGGGDQWMWPNINLSHCWLQSVIGNLAQTARIHLNKQRLTSKNTSGPLCSLEMNALLKHRHAGAGLLCLQLTVK